jgi:ankyrin repeat protein
MDLMIDNLDQPLPVEVIFMVLERCAHFDLEGPMASIFDHTELDMSELTRSTIIKRLFLEASAANAAEAMKLLWTKFSNGEGNRKVDVSMASFNLSLSSVTNPAAPKSAKELLNESHGQLVLRTALHNAAEANAIQAIEFLLECGADIDLDIDGIGTPLALAATTFSSRDAAVLLLRRGASVYCKKSGGSGYTVLHHAVERADFELRFEQQFSLVRTLLEA